MGKIISGLASSHAYALQEPAQWDMMRQRTMERYKARFGKYPPLQARIAEETSDLREQRYQRIRSGLEFLKLKIAEQKPDALILVGDDQDENFTEDNLPQIAVYAGGDFSLGKVGPLVSGHKNLLYRNHGALAADLLNRLVEQEFDVATVKRFPNDTLLSHAHCQILARMVPAADIPVVLLFLNAIHVPAIGPARCYRLGQAIKNIIAQRTDGERVAIYGSGGLSHFTSGYPWEFYQGPHDVGSISEEFDCKVVSLIASGQGEKLAQLSSADLLSNGEIELRSWITVLGAVDSARPQLIVNEPFYSGVMSMGVAYWAATD